MTDSSQTTPRTSIRVDWRTPYGLSWTEADEAPMERQGHALRVGDDIWLVDPFDGADLDDELATLGGQVRHVVVLLDRHLRDAEQLARRHGATLHVVAGPRRRSVPADADRFDVRLADAPFTVVPVRSTGVLWQERALWWPEHALLVVAESLGSSRAFRIGSDAPVAVHPALRLTPPTSAFARAAPDTILFGHGPAVTERATEAIQTALAESRVRAPQFALGVARAALARVRGA